MGKVSIQISLDKTPEEMIAFIGGSLDGIIAFCEPSGLTKDSIEDLRKLVHEWQCAQSQS